MNILHPAQLELTSHRSSSINILNCSSVCKCKKLLWIFMAFWISLYIIWEWKEQWNKKCSSFSTQFSWQKMQSLKYFGIYVYLPVSILSGRICDLIWAIINLWPCHIFYIHMFQLGIHPYILHKFLVWAICYISFPRLFVNCTKRRSCIIYIYIISFFSFFSFFYIYIYICFILMCILLLYTCQYWRNLGIPVMTPTAQVP